MITHSLFLLIHWMVVGHVPVPESPEPARGTNTCYMLVENLGNGQWGIACAGGCGTLCDDWYNPETRFVTCLCDGQTPKWTCQSFFNPTTGQVLCTTIECTGECDANPLPGVGQFGFVCGCDGN